MTASERAGRALADVMSFVDTVLDDFDVVELLTDLARRGVEATGAASVAVLLADPTGDLHVMSTAAPRSSDVALWELQRTDGPCRQCHDTGAVVTVGDLGTARDRWPAFAPAALDDGFVAAHAVPMRAAGRVLGSLGLLGREPGELDTTGVTVAQALAQVATVAVVQSTSPTGRDVNEQLYRALTARTVVEQARGLVAQHFDVSVDRALDLLRARAAADHRHLTEVARELMSDSASRAAAFAAMRATG